MATTTRLYNPVIIDRYSYEVTGGRVTAILDSPYPLLQHGDHVDFIIKWLDPTKSTLRYAKDWESEFKLVPMVKEIVINIQSGTRTIILNFEKVRTYEVEV